MTGNDGHDHRQQDPPWSLRNATFPFPLFSVIKKHSSKYSKYEYIYMCEVFHTSFSEAVPADPAQNSSLIPQI